MVPETAVSLLAFLLLISPGLIFEWLRRLHRPAIDRSAFEEVATVVVASLAFIGIAALVLAAVNLAHTEVLAAVWTWVQTGNDYFTSQPRRSVATVAFATSVAWASAVAANWLLSQDFYIDRVNPLVRSVAAVKGDREMGAHATLWSVLRGRVPKQAKSVWLTVELHDGQEFVGAFYGCDTAGEPDARMLALKQPLTTRTPRGESYKTDPAGHWSVLVIPIREIRSALVLYNEESA